MANEIVTIGSKQIMLQNPKRDLNILSRKAGGKYYADSLGDSLARWLSDPEQVIATSGGVKFYGEATLSIAEGELASANNSWLAGWRPMLELVA